MTAPTTSPREVALDHYADRLSLVDAAGEVAGQMWDEVDPANIAESWAGQLPELTAIVSGAQFGAARPADPYLDDVLDAQDLDDEALSPIDPAGFAGVASDGRGLLSLLNNPTIVTLLAIQDGVDVGRALLGGRTNLDMLVRTQVADAGRLADQVALTARPAATGYVRVAVGRTCARCLILAGRTYRWNQGFDRHPRCDCIHLPTALAAAGRLRQDPLAIYNRMSAAERTRAGFTIADQRALADGADIGQVVNAHRGMQTAGVRRVTTEGATKRGLAGARLRGRQRLSVDEIYRIAGDDRDEALRLLHRNGYLVEAPVRRADVALAARQAPSEAADPALKMTVAQLKQLAKDNGVPLFGATRKRDIIVTIRQWEGDKLKSGGRKLLPDGPIGKPILFGPAAIQAPPLGKPDPRSPVLSGARFNDWSDELNSGPLGSTADTPPEGFRVRDLRVHITNGGYVVTTGTAWRFNGIAYLIEHHPNDFGAPWVSRALAELRAAHNSIPAAARANRSYTVLLGESPDNDYWRRRFNNPAHSAAASAGSGHINIWHFNPSASRINVDVLRHETGHNVDDMVGRRAAGSDSSDWATAVDADVSVAASIQDLSPTQHEAVDLAKVEPGRGWPKGVTRYGRSSAQEDWAESIMLYQLGPIATGHLPGMPVPDLSGIRLPPGVVAVLSGEVLYFRDIYPHRADILDRLFPDVAAAQKREIAALRAAAAPTAANDRMTVAQLRALAKDRGLRNYSRMRKAELLDALRANANPPTALEIAKARQAAIDAVRPVADLLAKLDEALANGAEQRVLLHHVNTTTAAAVPAATRDALRRAIATGDAARIRRALSTARTKFKLKAVGQRSGATAVFDSASHSMVGGHRPPPGTRIEIVRVGYSVILPNGEVVVITKAEAIRRSVRRTR